jgi:hypothetical protein
MIIQQLSFDFTWPIEGKRKISKQTWQARVLARRHNIPLHQAEIYATEMGLLGTGGPSWVK